MRRLTEILFLLLFITCCTEQHVEKRQKDITICKKIDHIDSLSTDTVIYYWYNGSIKKIVEYTKGLESSINGWVCFFDSCSGNIEQKEYYIDGKSSFVYVYHHNGNVKIFTEGRAGIQFGNRYIYDSLGRLTAYMLLDFDQLKAYRKEYFIDELQKITFQQDLMISQYYFSNKYNEYINHEEPLYTNMKYVYNAIIPKPPDKIRSIELFKLDSLNNVLESKIISDTTGIIEYTFSFDVGGTYSISMRCKIISYNDSIELEDSITHKLSVLNLDSAPLPHD